MKQKIHMLSFVCTDCIWLLLADSMSLSLFPIALLSPMLFAYLQPVVDFVMCVCVCVFVARYVFFYFVHFIGTTQSVSSHAKVERDNKKKSWEHEWPSNRHTCMTITIMHRSAKMICATIWLCDNQKTFTFICTCKCTYEPAENRISLHSSCIHEI